MAAFSYSAPRFTEEDRQQELALLSKKERELIEQELKGSDNIFNEREDERELFFRRMEEELEKIPLSEKIAYEQALVHIPELVESESSHLLFLRKHNFDVTAAAWNLVSYWTQRVKVFGSEKAFLPMTIRGAMQDDFETLATGFLQIIGTDNHGRVIIHHEKPKADPQLHHRSSLWKTWFYILHVAASDPDVQKRGIVVILNFITCSMKDLDRLYGKGTTNVCRAGPLRIKGVHVPTPSTWILAPSVYTPVLLFVLSKVFRILINFYTSVEDLEYYGLSLSNILTSRSQIREVANFERWLDDQAQRERDI
eukprot:CAMPEP_0195308610 /NCGR_PEP_ID=MMETSP0707-20130614/38318_1 /TAXON_ID=33640 /ORGANISM="Asterionellopsis glacialis, Strain CCMP134" /LENGTH=309 /DNA_ID=CAMNT_0040372889 /DNA_START=88 /DNA_END=1017 /DNA_ORIENTATION=+